MQYLLDTNAIIRHFAQVSKLGKKAKEIIIQAENDQHHLFVSIALKYWEPLLSPLISDLQRLKVLRLFGSHEGHFVDWPLLNQRIFD